MALLGRSCVIAEALLGRCRPRRPCYNVPIHASEDGPCIRLVCLYVGDVWVNAQRLRRRSSTIATFRSTDEGKHSSRDRLCPTAGGLRAQLYSLHRYCWAMTHSRYRNYSGSGEQDSLGPPRDPLGRSPQRSPPGRPPGTSPDYPILLVLWNDSPRDKG